VLLLPQQGVYPCQMGPFRWCVVTKSAAQRIAPSYAHHCYVTICDGGPKIHELLAEKLFLLFFFLQL